MEKILAFHFDETKQRQLKQITGALKMRCEFIPDSQFMQPLESLISCDISSAAASYQGDVPEQCLLLMCDFSDKRMDRLLLALKKQQVQIDYKAVLTPTNKKWNVLRLMLEMQAEKAAYEALLPQHLQQ